MWGMATLAIEVSSASMKVARVTVMAMAQGLARGRHVSWNVVVAAAATPGPFRMRIVRLAAEAAVEQGSADIRLTESGRLEGWWRYVILRGRCKVLNQLRRYD